MELWDIYDSNKQRTGRTMKRNDWCLKDGEYHLTVLGVIVRPDGKFLITQRVMTKSWAPGWWEVSGGAAQDLHIHDIDYVLSLFGEPKAFYSVKNTLSEKNSYVNTLMQYENHVVTVEGTWDLPGSHPFEATFRVVFEQAVVENAGGKFMLYTTEGAGEIVIEKKLLEGGESVGGNISDLGGYYNELAYFCERAGKGEKIICASLSDAAKSLKFLKKELEFHA